MKKILIPILILTFVLMLVPNLISNAATSNYTITINHKDGMKAFDTTRFVAYQLFAGKTNGTTNQLSDITWGTGVDPEALITNLKKSTIKDQFSTVSYDEAAPYESAIAVAEILENYKEADKDEFLRLFARCVKASVKESGKLTSEIISKNAVIDVKEPGYYIVIDTDQNTNKEDNAISDFILSVVGKVDVNVKADIPSLDKKIIVNNTQELEGTTADVGSTVTFRLTGTLPDNYDDYETYYYAFNDTLSGFTYKTGTIVVKLNDNELTENTDWKLTVGDSTLKIVISNLKTVTNKYNIKDNFENVKITVQYDVTVNKDAVIANADKKGNPNTAYIEYSNDPNSEQKGETKKDIVYVYTFGLNILKVEDGKTNVLPNAEFTLTKGNQYASFEKTNGKYIFKGWVSNTGDNTKLVSDDNGKILIEGLAEGTYKLTETKPPEGYDLLKEDVTVIIGADISTTGVLNGYTITASGSGASYTDNNVKIPNKYSKVLPSTGGIGTIIFYSVGGILIIATACYAIFNIKSKKSKH